MLLNNGDCIEVMQRLIDDGVQVDSVVTDPPYHLTSIVERFGKEGSAPAQEGTDGAFARASKGFMGKEWDGGDIAFRQETWELAYKLLKPGGHLLAFSASRNYHRMAVAIEDAGFEIRDQIMWIYGSGFPKSHNIGKAIDAIEKTGKSTPKALRETRMGDDYEPTGQKDYAKGRMFSSDIENDNHEHKVNNDWEGWGTALKPAHEPIVMARKPLLEKSIAENVLKHGTGGINIDGCRIEGNDAKYPDTNPDFRDQGKKSKEAIGINKLSFGQVQDAKRKEIEKEENNLGRFPANVMHDGSDVVEDIFPMTSKSAGGGGSKTVSPSDNVYQGGWGHKEYDKTVGFGDEGSAARYFYCPKVSKEERNRGLDHLPTKKTSSMSGRRDAHDMEGYSIDNDVTGRFVTERKNVHPTVKPIELMKYLCRLVTPKGGTVLDPFMGSGSTGMAAKDEGFDFIGIEKDEEYFKICESRIVRFAPLMDFM